MARNHDAEAVAADLALRRLHPRHPAAFRADAGDLALLDDVHPHGRARPRIAPGHRVVPRGAGARLPEPAEGRVARPVEVDDRHKLLHPLGADELGRHALQRVGMRGAPVAAHLVLGLRQHDHAARAEHDVVIQILAQPLVEVARLLVDRGGRVLEIVRPDDRRVPPRVAAAKPALLDHRDIGDAVVLAEVIGRGQPVTAGADDDHLVAFPGFGRGPGAFPARVMAQGFPGDGKGGIAFHGRTTPVVLSGFLDR